VAHGENEFDTPVIEGASCVALLKGSSFFTPQFKSFFWDGSFPCSDARGQRSADVVCVQIIYNL